MGHKHRGEQLREAEDPRGPSAAGGFLLGAEEKERVCGKAASSELSLAAGELRAGPRRRARGQRAPSAAKLPTEATDPGMHLPRSRARQQVRGQAVRAPGWGTGVGFPQLPAPGSSGQVSFWLEISSGV